MSKVQKNLRTSLAVLAMQSAHRIRKMRRLEVGEKHVYGATEGVMLPAISAQGLVGLGPEKGATWDPGAQ